MNRVAIRSEEDPLPLQSESAERFILTVLDRLEHDRWDLSVLFCRDTYIRTLNSRFRHKNEATDVLSFPLGETVEEAGEIRYLPGDIVISLETLAENARYFKVPPEEELRRLLIHGILHLAGMDHATNADIEPMLRLQESLMAELAEERIPLRLV
ncbi:MAG: rRNA maturation RNase YbeY [Spirochaetaceae bacterium]|jgi:probable rRNA maturation factor|nr:rRNA maturation RNase YbeY [Spirochaetaceae bacterium]